MGVQCHLTRAVWCFMGIVEPAKRGNLSRHQNSNSSPHLLDGGFFIGGEMAGLYTKEDLLIKDKIFANRLTTQVLQDFYTENLTHNVYVYTLNNGETIRLIFYTDQFCHLIGLSYFGYNGVVGWNSLMGKNILVSKLSGIGSHKREEIRITNFNKIVKILDNPKVYLYKNTDMRYQSDYFAVYDDGVRYYKLGIGTTSNGMNYGETYQVSLMASKDNKEIDPNNLLVVTSKTTLSRSAFQDTYNS